MQDHADEERDDRRRDGDLSPEHRERDPGRERLELNREIGERPGDQETRNERAGVSERPGEACSARVRLSGRHARRPLSSACRAFLVRREASAFWFPHAPIFCATSRNGKIQPGDRIKTFAY